MRKPLATRYPARRGFDRHPAPARLRALALGLLRSTGNGLECVARYDGSIPGFWTFKSGDKILVGDFDGDGKTDIAIFNGSDWVMPYLGVLRSAGTHLAGIHRYDGSIPGWIMKPGNQFFVGDFDGDKKADLFVF